MGEPIPAFYCCYLLRSRNHKSYYIGSTPNPARRLGQHNGASKGGAKRTSAQTKRPWEMTCIVAGFSSKLAALQFEWAWQNAHLTRHIDRDVRQARTEQLQKKKAVKDEQASKRKTRPPASLEARLKNLHYLLGVPSFKRWALHVRFFAPDVWALWERHTAKLEPKLRSGITVTLTPAEPPSENDPHKIPHAIKAIPVKYEDCKAHVEKAKALLESGRSISCSLCGKKADPAQAPYPLVCPFENCQTISHMSCMAKRFLQEEGSTMLVPLEGTCPGCHHYTEWMMLIKEMRLRTQGQHIVEALLKPKRRKQVDNARDVELDEPPELLAEDEELDETWMENVDNEDELPELLSIGRKQKAKNSIS